jgi:uncharacterized membrane protein YbhN (UPF0104 family)
MRDLRIIEAPLLTRKHARGILQIAISVILLVIVLRQVNWADLRAAMARMELAWLGLAWLLYLLGFVVRAARWRVLLSGLGIRRPLGELTIYYFVGGFFNVLLPTGFGGDAVRVIELSQDTQRVGAALNSVVVDRYLGLMALLGMGLFAGLLYPDPALLPALAVIAVFFGGGIAAAWLFSRGWWARLSEGEYWLARAIRAARLQEIAAGLRQYGVPVIAKALAISVAFNLLQIGWNAAIAVGLGLRLPAAFYFVFVPLTSAALLLPAFGGLGVRELTYVTLLGSVGVPQAQALALSLGIYAITAATALVGGLLYLRLGLRHARAGV